MFRIDRHPGGRNASAIFGAACLIDGLVRVLSFGRLYTDLPLKVSRWQARKSLR